MSDCCHDHGQGHEQAHPIDPVCGMTVDPSPEAGKPTFEYQGETFYFCNPKCREKFAEDPERYLHPDSAEPEDVPEGAVWICPM
ncbi:MAG: YHS domain-containing protein, partial [Candidatus Dadabacteria bacterium]